MMMQIKTYVYLKNLCFVYTLNFKDILNHIITIEWYLYRSIPFPMVCDFSEDDLNRSMRRSNLGKSAWLRKDVANQM